MSKVTARVTAFVGHNGVPTPLVTGDEYDENHPLVQAHPEHFTEPVVPAPTRGPGRPLGSKNKSSTDD